MFEMPRIALLILVLFVYSVATTGFGFGFPAGGVVIQGLITGAVMGNIPLGFYLGGTYELMNIGLNPLGGSVVPNYNLGVVVGVAFGAATGSTETGMAAGIVVATLSTSLTLLGRMINTAFFHKAQECNRKHDFKGVVRWARIGFWPNILTTPIVLAILFFLGAPVVEAINNVIPAWLLHGFQVAGNMLPAVGFAILLRSMSLKENLQYLIIGFALFAYLGVGALGCALFGIALAMIAYYTNVKIADAQNMGGVGDE